MGRADQGERHLDPVTDDASRDRAIKPGPVTGSDERRPPSLVQPPTDREHAGSSGFVTSPAGTVARTL